MYCKLTQLPTVGEIIDPREDYYYHFEYNF